MGPQGKIVLYARVNKVIKKVTYFGMTEFNFFYISTLGNPFLYNYHKIRTFLSCGATSINALVCVSQIFCMMIVHPSNTRSATSCPSIVLGLGSMLPQFMALCVCLKILGPF